MVIMLDTLGADATIENMSGETAI